MPFHSNFQEYKLYFFTTQLQEHWHPVKTYSINLTHTPIFSIIFFSNRQPFGHTSDTSTGKTGSARSTEPHLAPPNGLSRRDPPLKSQDNPSRGFRNFLVPRALRPRRRVLDAAAAADGRASITRRGLIKRGSLGRAIDRALAPHVLQRRKTNPVVRGIPSWWRALSAWVRRRWRHICRWGANFKSTRSDWCTWNQLLLWAPDCGFTLR